MVRTKMVRRMEGVSGGVSRSFSLNKYACDDIVGHITKIPIHVYNSKKYLKPLVCLTFCFSVDLVMTIYMKLDQC